MANCKVIAVTNQKGGVGKTTTTANLGIGLAQENKRVLLIDADAQASLTLSLGYAKPDELPVTLADIMQDVIDDTPIADGRGILHHGEGVDLLPANIELSGMEIRLINAMSRESVLRTYINAVKPHYDYILIDCMPSLGMMPINSLAAADSVIIPSQPSFLSAKGLDLLMQSISKVKRQINPKLKIDGILFTMVDSRTNEAKEIIASLRSHYGEKIRVYAVTDSSGVARFDDVLIGTGYVLEEVDTAIRYVVPENQTAAVEWNTVTNKSFHNVLKKWNLTVTKSDNETGTPQGDASLAGATYGIYKGEQLIDTYTTNENGQFVTKYYVCGDDWSLREIEPSEGYLLDESVYHIGAEAKNYTVEYNAIASDVGEQIIKGRIALIKHTDDGDTGLETPEAGAEFEVFLKAASSYDAAKDTERDYLICDENGFAETKDLPYGIYTVHQVKGWDGRELLPDFDVYIAKNGEVYRYLANNANFESYIKIIKVDAETGKIIPYAGAGFQLYRPDGTLITQSFTYPEPVTIDTFYTNDEGWLITPEKLEYGTGYSLVEVYAPYGYVVKSRCILMWFRTLLPTRAVLP